MRKALLIIVLVGASFAGGAIVNGPGLQWLQSTVLTRMGIGEEKGPELVVSDGDLAGPTPSRDDVPSTPIPPLDLGLVENKQKTPDVTPKKAEQVANTPLPVLSPVPPDRAPEPSPPGLEPLTTSNDRERDALVLAASTTTATEEKTPSPPAALPRVPNDWSEVRRELKNLGVSRYGTEGEPSGKVRFHCVIPLAGRRAVGQHFEAEGDDELQAARAAIKRVVLWRATEAEAAR